MYQLWKDWSKATSETGFVSFFEWARNEPALWNYAFEVVEFRYQQSKHYCHSNAVADLIPVVKEVMNTPKRSRVPKSVATKIVDYFMKELELRKRDDDK